MRRPGTAFWGWVPDGIAARLALLLTLALLAANVVALALLGIERDRLGREVAIERAVERIVDAVPIIEALPPRNSERILRRTDRRFMNIAIEPRSRIDADVPIDARVRSFANRIADALEGREVRAALEDGSAENVSRRAGWRRSRQQLVLSIALTNGEWLNAVLRAPPRQTRLNGPATVLIALGLSLIAVLGAALFYVQRLIRPLRELATAARAAGRGDRTIRVSENGARELRDAAAAFNDMQARIARFDAERTRTLAAAGHDLRTPITSLRIRAEMLDDDAREPIVRTLDEMRVMADGLVAYARGEGDGEQAELIDLVPFLMRLCDERGATFLVPTAPKGRFIVRARPVALGRAIGNLIDNAIRYGGQARVGLSRTPTNARITVEDDGPGIPPDRIGAMLEPFVRGEASRSLDTGGAGLGLAIARNVLRSHDGTLDFANRVEGGLRASATLPVIQDP